MQKRFQQMYRLVASVLLAGVSHAHAEGYSFIDLSTPAASQSSATGINNLGQVVGTIQINGGPQAALWSGGNTLTTLNPLHAGDYSTARGINDLGQVVGDNWAPLDPGQYAVGAVVWNGVSPTALAKPALDGAPPNNPYSTAYSINNSGQMVGSSAWPYYSGNPTMWDNTTTVSPLGPVSGNCCGAGSAINDSGLAVGNSLGRARLFNGSAMTDLGSQLADQSAASAAYDINEAGQVVGWSGIANDRFATTWFGGKADVLASLGGKYSEANAVNNAGLIVGMSSITPGTTQYNYNPSDLHAAMWVGTEVIDLNSFLDAATVAAGWVLQSATDINDHGWIVGTATNSKLNVTHAFLLTTAVPEPSTFAMMLISLFALGVKVRSSHRVDRHVGCARRGTRLI